ncbi:MAG: hypothetical protein ABI686_14810, partial [Acidobacteriota bacterium]
FHLKIIGVMMIVLALVHGVFPKHFDWKTELRPLSLINRQVMYVHTFFIAVIVFLMGILCLTSTREIVETNLGQNLALGLGIFWFLRLLIQFFGYSSELWKGKTFETTIHILFSMLWTYFSVIFFLVYFTKL